MRECHICILPGQTHHALRDELARATKRKTDAYINPKTRTKQGCFVTRLAVLPCPTPITARPAQNRAFCHRVYQPCRLRSLPPLDRDVGLGAADGVFVGGADDALAGGDFLEAVRCPAR